MLKVIVRAGALAATVVAAPALAADFPRGPAIAGAPFSTYNWNGAYVGLNLGYQWGAVTNTGAKPNGIAGGVQAGYNWQSGQFVFGVETDIQASGAEDTFAPYKFSNPWFGTVRGRAGWAMNNILLYLTGGLAYGSGRVALGNLSEAYTRIGWTIGGGIEVGLSPNWSAKAEYLYFDLQDRPYGLTGLNHGFGSSLFRLGVNYRF
jgi:outer membrane immunogenic protein